ncbi:integrase, catalytic region, zinc finger, CCHC-type containing protein [Tanacetum coccineum]
MSTSTTHQQSLADASSETIPPMLERGSYEFKDFTPSESEPPRPHTKKDLIGDDLKHYEAEIEAMNLILISIPNDIYNSMDACTSAQAMWQRVERLMRGTMQNKVDRDTHFNNEFDQFVAELGEALVSVYNRFAQLMNDLEEMASNSQKAKKLEKSHDPIALVAHTGSSSRTTSPYYVTHPSSVVDYDDDYQGDAVQNTFEDPLTSAMILLARAITQRFSNPINNRLRTSSNTRNQANVQCYNCSEKSHYARNCPKPRVRDSKYFIEQMLLAKQDKARVILIDEHNDFLFSDATRMEKIEELSANIRLMARIQPANINYDAGPGYDSVFLSEVQTPSINYENTLFAKDNQEQKFPKQSKIINDTFGDDQIDSNIIFDEPKIDVNSGSVECDNNVQESYKLEQLARNAYKEAEKQQIIAKKLSVVELKRQIVELQKTQTILKQKMSENEDKYHDAVIDLEVRAKKNEDVVLKIGNSLQGMFMLGPKPVSFYDSNVKHGLGYENPYTLKKAISQNPKLYDVLALMIRKFM